MRFGLIAGVTSPATVQCLHCKHVTRNPLNRRTESGAGAPADGAPASVAPVGTIPDGRFSRSPLLGTCWMCGMAAALRLCTVVTVSAAVRNSDELRLGTHLIC